LRCDEGLPTAAAGQDKIQGAIVVVLKEGTGHVDEEVMSSRHVNKAMTLAGDMVVKEELAAMPDIAMVEAEKVKIAGKGLVEVWVTATAFGHFVEVLDHSTGNCAIGNLPMATVEVVEVVPDVIEARTGAGRVDRAVVVVDEEEEAEMG
jgi:hypothetical protein